MISVCLCKAEYIVRTRMRTPHPSAFGCHLPPLGKAFGKCEQRYGRIWNPPLQASIRSCCFCRGDSRITRNVVRTYQEPSPVGEGGSRRLTDEVSVSLFALPFGGAQTNTPSQTSVGEGLAPPAVFVSNTYYRRNFFRNRLRLCRSGCTQQM